MYVLKIKLLLLERGMSFPHLGHVRLKNRIKNPYIKECDKSHSIYS
jgi:hypothetical protein